MLISATFMIPIMPISINYRPSFSVFSSLSLSLLILSSFSQHTLIPQLIAQVAVCIAGRVSTAGFMTLLRAATKSSPATYSACTLNLANRDLASTEAKCTVLYNAGCDVGDELQLAQQGQAKWYNRTKAETRSREELGQQKRVRNNQSFVV